MSSTLHSDLLPGREDRQGNKGPWLGRLPPNQKSEGMVGDSLLQKVQCRWVGEDLWNEGLWVTF